jgi:hypothetical protein
MDAIARRVQATLLGIVLASSLQAGAQAPAPAPARAPAAQAGAGDTHALARDLLLRSARFLAQAPRFSVSMASNYDSVQSDGEKIEFGERRKVTLERPAQLRVETERSDGSQGGLVFTGKEILLVDITNKVYATEPQPGGIDDSIVHLISDLGVRLPLALLLSTRLPAEFERRIRSINYVEKTNVLGVPAHHLAARGDTVDFQIWIQDGAQPVPLRVVITYRDEPGKPQFRAALLGWNFAPAITPTTFAPQMPAGATRIAFATQLAAGARKMSAPKGGQR